MLSNVIKLSSLMNCVLPQTPRNCSKVSHDQT